MPDLFGQLSDSNLAEYVWHLNLSSFKGSPIPAVKESDLARGVVPRAIFLDPIQDLLLREEGYCGIPRKLILEELKPLRNVEGDVLQIESRQRRIDQSRYDKHPEDDEFFLTPDSQKPKLEADETREVTLSEAGIDIFNYNYKGIIRPFRKPRIRSPNDQKAYLRSKISPPKYASPQRFGSNHNCISTAKNHTYVAACNEKCRQMLQSMSSSIQQTILTYEKEPIKSSSPRIIRGSSFLGRGKLDLKLGWLNAVDLDQDVLGEISELPVPPILRPNICTNQVSSTAVLQQLEVTIPEKKTNLIENEDLSQNGRLKNNQSEFNDAKVNQSIPIAVSEIVQIDARVLTAQNSSDYLSRVAGEVEAKLPIIIGAAKTSETEFVESVHIEEHDFTCHSNSVEGVGQETPHEAPPFSVLVTQKEPSPIDSNGNISIESLLSPVDDDWIEKERRNLFSEWREDQQERPSSPKVEPLKKESSLENLDIKKSESKPNIVQEVSRVEKMIIEHTIKLIRPHSMEIEKESTESLKKLSEKDRNDCTSNVVESPEKAFSPSLNSVTSTTEVQEKKSHSLFKVLSRSFDMVARKKPQSSDDSMHKSREGKKSVDKINADSQKSINSIASVPIIKKEALESVKASNELFLEAMKIPSPTTLKSVTFMNSNDQMAKFEPINSHIDVNPLHFQIEHKTLIEPPASSLSSSNYKINSIELNLLPTSLNPRNDNDISNKFKQNDDMCAKNNFSIDQMEKPIEPLIILPPLLDYNNKHEIGDKFIKGIQKNTESAHLSLEPTANVFINVRIGDQSHRFMNAMDIQNIENSNLKSKNVDQPERKLEAYNNTTFLDTTSAAGASVEVKPVVLFSTPNEPANVQTMQEAPKSFVANDSNSENLPKELCHPVKEIPAAKEILALPPLPQKENPVASENIELELAKIQIVKLKEQKCKIQVQNLSLHCYENAIDKPLKHFFPLELRRIVSISQKDNLAIVNICISRKGDKDGGKLKTLKFNFEGLQTCTKWIENISQLSFGNLRSYQDKSILVLLEKADKDSQKLFERYMKEIFEISARPLDVKIVQYNEFSVANSLSGYDMGKIGNIVLTKPDFVSRLQQVLVRDRLCANPVNLECEHDPVFAALTIVRCIWT